MITGLKEQIRRVCHEEFLVCGEGEEQGGAWMEKVKKSLFISVVNIAYLFNTLLSNTQNELEIRKYF
jgi:hypothetical protein